MYKGDDKTRILSITATVPIDLDEVVGSWGTWRQVIETLRSEYPSPAALIADLIQDNAKASYDVILVTEGVVMQQRRAGGIGA